MVKQFGFRDVEDYYNAATLTDKLHRIQVPLLGLNAADDPFIPFKGEPRWGWGGGAWGEV